MTLLYSVATGDIVQAADVNQFKNMLEGASGYTSTFLLRSTSGANFVIRLGDAAGTNKLSIQDSAGVEQAYINSDGLVSGNSITFATLNLPTSATPSQTTEGQIIWDTDNDRLTVGSGSATIVFDPNLPFSAAAEEFVETSGYKQFFGLGPPSNASGGTYTDNETVGMGFLIRRDVTTASTAASTDTTGGDNGGWSFVTGATASEDAGVLGPRVVSASDWTLTWRGRIPSAADQLVFIGAKASATSFLDENNIIGFRVSGTGNVIGVCDSTGTETTRDTSATGATELTLRIEVRDAGATVRFYKNNVQVGADVTTNIPTTALTIACGIFNTAGSNVNFITHDLFGWREV